MPLDVKDATCLWDMLDAARAATEFTAGQRYEHFIADRKTRNAVERNLEIIGEAARRVSARVRENHPGIPWKSMIGFRNLLAHEYGEIRYEIVWSVVQEKLPPLIRQLEAMNVDCPPPAEEP
ncbi:MAG TPA: DUF86 domain-containing protein [Candidatus Hydrogenedentes bacterium]|nr:DUF86 domain-containing protein [Candidatus Hydrogenedentota bacterium]